MSNAAEKIWQAPLLLGIITLFGLLAALLGTGGWYALAWAAMILPLGVIVYFVWRGRQSTRK